MSFHLRFKFRFGVTDMRVTSAGDAHWVSKQRLSGGEEECVAVLNSRLTMVLCAQ